MVRLVTAAATAAMAIGAVSARLNADQILTFNLTLLPSHGVFSWYPFSEQQDGSGPGAAQWVATYPEWAGQNWSSSLIATGTPLYSSNQTYIFPTMPPRTYINVPAHAFYLQGSFTAVNGTDTNGQAMRTYVSSPELQDSDPVARLSTSDYLRYIDGLEPFTYHDVGFGVPVSSYQGGGNFTVESVIATLSAVTTAKTAEDFLGSGEVHFVFQQGNGKFDPAMTCTDGVFLRADAESQGSGFEYFNARFFANDTSQNCVIKVPDNTSMVFLNGTTGFYYDNMMIEWNPPLPDGMSSRSTVNDITTHTTYVRRKELLHVQTLDPRVSYTLTFKAKPNYTGEAFISVHSFTFFSAISKGNVPTYGNDTSNNPVTTPTVRKSSNMGAIVGGAIGGVLGALCIAGLAFWLWLQHRRKNRPLKGGGKEHGSNFDINDPNVTPFVERATTTTTDPTMSEAPSSPMLSRGRPETGNADESSHFFSDEDLLSPTSAAYSGGDSSTSKTPIASGSTDAEGRPVRPPMPRREVISEMDAGTLQPIEEPAVEYEYVPPQYNPEWAQRSTDALSTVGTTSDVGRRSTMGASTLGAASFRSDHYDTATSNGGTPMFEESDPMSPSSTHSYPYSLMSSVDPRARSPPPLPPLPQNLPYQPSTSPYPPSRQSPQPPQPPPRSPQAPPRQSPQPPPRPLP